MEYSGRKLKDRIAKSVVDMQFLDLIVALEFIIDCWSEKLWISLCYLAIKPHIPCMQIVLVPDVEQHHD